MAKYRVVASNDIYYIEEAEFVRIEDGRLTFYRRDGDGDSELVAAYNAWNAFYITDA